MNSFYKHGVTLQILVKDNLKVHLSLASQLLLIYLTKSNFYTTLPSDYFSFFYIFSLNTIFLSKW